jgi:hypothetical protein
VHKELVKGVDGDVLFVGQHGMKFDEGGIGMIADELSDFLFVRFEFSFGTSFVLFRFDASGFTSSFPQVVDPGDADGIFSGGIFT